MQTDPCHIAALASRIEIAKRRRVLPRLDDWSDNLTVLAASTATWYVVSVAAAHEFQNHPASDRTCVATYMGPAPGVPKGISGFRPQPRRKPVRTCSRLSTVSTGDRASPGLWLPTLPAEPEPGQPYWPTVQGPRRRAWRQRPGKGP